MESEDVIKILAGLSSCGLFATIGAVIKSAIKAHRSHVELSTTMDSATIVYIDKTSGAPELLMKAVKTRQGVKRKMVEGNQVILVTGRFFCGHSDLLDLRVVNTINLSCKMRKCFSTVPEVSVDTLRRMLKDGVH